MNSNSGRGVALDPDATLLGTGSRLPSSARDSYERLPVLRDGRKSENRLHLHPRIRFAISREYSGKYLAITGRSKEGRMAVLGSRSSRKRKLSSMSFSTEGGFSANRSSISATRTRTRCSVRAAPVTVTFHSSGPSASMEIMPSMSRVALQNTSFWRRERFFAAVAKKRYKSSKARWLRITDDGSHILWPEAD